MRNIAIILITLYELRYRYLTIYKKNIRHALFEFGSFKDIKNQPTPQRILAKEDTSKWPRR